MTPENQDHTRAFASSTLYQDLFGDAETAALFSEASEIRSMLQVEAALAKVQGVLRLVPPKAADFLMRACHEAQLDPASLARKTAVNGVPVPALLAELHAAYPAPEHMQYLHPGATSKDIMDTALALRLTSTVDLWQNRFDALIRGLGQLAAPHADLPMAAGTYGQIATPTSFGAVAASWGRALPTHRAALESVRAAVLAGTLSAMVPKGPQVRAELAEALGSVDPGHSWHAERAGIAALAGWMAGLFGSLGQLGKDLLILTQSGLAQVHLTGSGGSSTMPQKCNPIGPSVLVALARHGIGLAASLQGAALHRHQRDGASWFTECLPLPALCTSLALTLSLDIVDGIMPDHAAMAHRMNDSNGLIHAEALAFVLAQQMPRPEAQARIKALCQEVEATGSPLPTRLARDFPDTD